MHMLTLRVNKALKRIVWGSNALTIVEEREAAAMNYTGSSLNKIA